MFFLYTNLVFRYGTSMQLLFVERPSAPQVCHISSWGVYFRSNYEYSDTLSIDLGWQKSSQAHHIIKKFQKYRQVSLVFISFHWIIITFHCILIGFYWIVANYRLSFARLGPWYRSIECSNTCKLFENGFSVKKYIGAIMRKSYQLTKATEIEHLENTNPCTKKT